MPCYSPLKGYKSALVTAEGKRKIVFSRQSGFSDLPIEVPCGQCIGCRIDRSRMWAIRCVHEAKFHLRNSFVTLTYDQNNIPTSNSLVKEHLQLFFKRLRKAGYVFRYYACGEYGEDSNRPHYHVVFFGINFDFDRKQHSKPRDGVTLYTSKILSDTWGMGHCIIGDFSYQSAAYVARYCMKKHNITGEDDYHYTRVDSSSGEIFNIQPEFALMSRRPGLGSDWYDKYKSDAFPSDFLVHKGKKHPVPSYYIKKLEKEDSNLYKDIKLRRKKNMQENALNSTPDRLFVREEVKKAKLNQLKRSI